MGKCKFCGKKSPIISEILSVCRECILNHDWNRINPHILNVHENVRKMVVLPGVAPKVTENNMALKCNQCINECVIGKNESSYCGLRNLNKHEQGLLPLPSKDKAYIHGYIDPNPTNCCNAWLCPAGTENGFPQYSDICGPEYGTLSYAAFLYGCSFNCLFCQNSSHKNIKKSRYEDSSKLVKYIINDKRITCICFFGGTPEPQLPFTLSLTKAILKKIQKKDPNRKFRTCWEWNGSGKRDLVEKCMKIAVKTGGNIKFDLKAFHKKLNIAMCGISNSRTLKNFKYLAESYFGTREGLPEMSACTLLVPGYTTKDEVEKIARYISNINENIPYSLLVFHPDYQMQDLPVTPKKQAIECYTIAKKYLKNINLGNKFLLNFS